MKSFCDVITLKSDILTRVYLRMCYMFALLRLISLHACSLAKCVEVGLFHVENKGSNNFNMTFKTISTFEFPLYA